MIAGVRLAMDIFRRPVLSKVQRAPFSVPVSDAEADIVAFTAGQTGTNYHPSGTCAIGRVVDSDLRVSGPKDCVWSMRRYAVDCPRQSNAAVIAIAEKAADILLGKGPTVAER